MPGISDPQNFILFVTACNCCRMQRAAASWIATPDIVVPLNLPAVAVHDWVDPPTDDLMTTRVGTRRFRLRDEIMIPMGRIFTYEEVQ